jgi:hypothetical protein
MVEMRSGAAQSVCRGAATTELVWIEAGIEAASIENARAATAMLSDPVTAGVACARAPAAKRGRGEAAASAAGETAIFPIGPTGE